MNTRGPVCFRVWSERQGNGQTICEHRTLNHRRTPRSHTITSVARPEQSGHPQGLPTSLFLLDFQFRTHQGKPVSSANQSHKIPLISSSPPPAFPGQQLPIRTYLKPSPFFSFIKLSQSSICLWASAKGKWWWLTLLLLQELNSVRLFSFGWF